MPLIKNEKYRQFFDEGIIETLGEEDIQRVLENITGKNSKEGRALLIALYYTGARPNEILNLRAKDLLKERSYLKVKLRGSKGGLPRTLYLPLRHKMVKELASFSVKNHPDMYLFWNYRGRYNRTHINKKGEIKQYVEIGDKLRYHMYKWFDTLVQGGVPPYFLRHNRFTKLAENDATAEDIRQWKGSKTLASVTPYLHMSSRTGKKLARKLR